MGALLSLFFAMHTFFRRLLRSQESQDGTPTGAPPSATPPLAAPVAPAPVAPKVEPPPAAKIVLESDAEPADAAEIVRLKEERDQKSAALKERETRIAHLEDENRKLKEIPSAPAKAKGSPWTFFDAQD